VLLVCTVYSVLYSEIALSRKPFGIGYMYIYTFLLRLADTMTSNNTDLPSWDTLWRELHEDVDREEGGMGGGTGS
jgi:hypothetical protein